MYWGEVKGILANICNQMRKPVVDPSQFDYLSLVAAGALKDADQYREGLNEVLTCEALILHKLLPCKDLFTHEQVQRSVSLIHKYLINKHAKKLSKAWSSYVKDQLSIGGAKLYKYISK